MHVRVVVDIWWFPKVKIIVRIVMISGGQRWSKWWLATTVIINRIIKNKIKFCLSYTPSGHYYKQKITF
jgi:hypothetical protein